MNRSPSRLRVRVTATAETLIRSGHPWVFAKSVRQQNRPGLTGELAAIYDRHDRFLAIGLFDPHSPIRIRVLHIGKPEPIDRRWWQQRLEKAVARRQGLFDRATNGYRVANGESDGWPGLVLDRYGTTFVVKIYSAAWFPHLDEIISVIANELRSERIVLRLSRNIQAPATKEFHRLDGEILSGAPLQENVVFEESGLKFEADVLRGQKTGFFLDQRENRRRVESLSSGRDVLNAFSFSGGFSLYAARGGARSLTDLDISSHALASSDRNFRLNHRDKRIASCSHKRIQADAFEWLQTKSASRFDLLILDPPSLAKRESEKVRALHAYANLAQGGIDRLRPRGILVAASCSAHVSAAEFFEVIRGAAGRSKRKWTELQTSHHPPDHPASFKEAEYLKCIYVQF